MEPELFTFVTCDDLGHHVSHIFFTRANADLHFDKLCSAAGRNTLLIAYYCGSVGGLVNASTEF